jgi:hypothetical protein
MSSSTFINSLNLTITTDLRPNIDDIFLNFKNHKSSKRTKSNASTRPNTRQTYKGNDYLKTKSNFLITNPLDNDTNNLKTNPDILSDSNISNKNLSMPKINS